MIPAATAEFLESGCSLVVGALGGDGEPYATRAWGLDVLPGGGQVRLVLAAYDRLLEHGAYHGPLAVTAACVRTFSSLQLKGRVVAVEPATAADAARAARHCDAFFADVTAVDGTPRSLLDRFAPGAELVAAVVRVDELYDQTPGPGAGAAVPAHRP